MWEKHSFFWLLTTLCLSQQAATHTVHDGRSLESNLSPTTPSLAAEATVTSVVTETISLGEENTSNSIAADSDMKVSALWAIAAVQRAASAQNTASTVDPALASFSAAYSSQLAALSSADAEFSSVASFLATFTPVIPSVFPSGDTSVTITIDATSTLETSITTPTATSNSRSQSQTTQQSTSDRTSNTISSQRPSSATTDSTFSESKSRPSTATESTRPATTTESSISRHTITPSWLSHSTMMSIPITRHSSSTFSTHTRSSSSRSSDRSSMSSRHSSTTSHSSTSSQSSTSSTTSSSSTVSSSSLANSTNGTTPVPPSSASSDLSSGQIAGISVGSFGAALVGVAAIGYFLRRRSQKLAEARAQNQVYPEEAYLYDPPITPPPETTTASGAPQLGALGGVFASREFGNGETDRASGANANSFESFHTAAGANRTDSATPDAAQRGMSPDPDQTDERAGLIAPAATHGPLSNVPTAYTNTYPNNGAPIRNHINSTNNAFNPISPNTPRYVNPGAGSFPASSAARPIAYGLGLSTAAAASQAAKARSRVLSGEHDPNVAVSPADIRRGERMPLSPEGEGGDMGMGNRTTVTYGGADTGVRRVRRAWGW